MPTNRAGNQKIKSLLKTEKKMDMAKTTIDYKYLPVLIARLVNQGVGFTIAHAGVGDTGVEVHAQMHHRALEEFANESHGGFVIRVECSDVWQVAEWRGYDIEDHRYDASEAVLDGARQALSGVWVEIHAAIDSAMADYYGEKN